MSQPSSFARASVEGRKEVGAVSLTALQAFLADQAGVISVTDDSADAGCQHLSVAMGYWMLLPKQVPVLPEKPLTVLVRGDTYPMNNMFLEMTGSVSAAGAVPGWALTSKDDFWGYVFLAAKKALLIHRESFMAWFATQPEAEQLENWTAAQTTHLNTKKFASRGALMPVNRIMAAGDSNWVTIVDLAGYVLNSAQVFVKERNAN